MLRYFLFGLLLVVFSLALVFASVNSGALTLDLAFVELETTVALAMLGFFAAGWCFGVGQIDGFAQATSPIGVVVDAADVDDPGGLRSVCPYR